MPFPSDLKIARAAKLRPLVDVATDAGIPTEYLEPYGDSTAKIKLEAIEAMSDRPKARYVVVSAITPTPLGEGKTTTVVGLGQGFSHIGKKATIAIRQPSMGPTFGIKGGAAGGGYSQVVPMELLKFTPHRRHPRRYRRPQHVLGHARRSPFSRKQKQP